MTPKIHSTFQQEKHPVLVNENINSLTTCPFWYPPLQKAVVALCSKQHESWTISSFPDVNLGVESKIQQRVKNAGKQT